MTEYKNMAICDLRNVTLESAAEIESITNIAVLVYPKNPSPELSVALTKIPVKNVAATIYLEKDAPIAQRNGSCEISAKDFSSGSLVICNGTAAIHKIAPETEGSIMCNGSAIFHKSLRNDCKINMLALNGIQSYADFEEVRQYESKIVVDKDMLELMEEKMLILSEGKIIFAPDVSMELLKEKKPFFFSKEKIVCNNEISAYIKLNSMAEGGVKVRDMQEWDEEDDD